MVNQKPLLAAWDAVCRQSVIGNVGHHLTHQAGPAHPLRTAPPWVTSSGCDLSALHAAYSAVAVYNHLGEDRECGIGKIRHKRPRKRIARRNVIAMRRTA